MSRKLQLLPLMSLIGIAWFIFFSKALAQSSGWIAEVYQGNPLVRVNSRPDTEEPRGEGDYLYRNESLRTVNGEEVVIVCRLDGLRKSIPNDNFFRPVQDFCAFL